MFLYGESRETMMHVAGLLPFTPAPGMRPDHLRELVDEMRTGTPVFPPWNLKLRTPDLLRNPLQAWVEDEVDLEYHVRRSALPSPGDERELGILVSRLHSSSIDFHRPPWEIHLIEGLEGGRFAFYVKVHHALVDGFSAMRILANALSTDPEERRPLFFAIEQPKRVREVESEHEAGVHFPELLAAVREQYGATKSVARALLNVVESSRHERELVSPRQAPKCVLNARISRSRRFATQRLDAARIKAVAKAAGGTVNDVILALSSTCLRRYLLERDALPSEPLVAMLPVAIQARVTAEHGSSGNAVGAILATLATDLDDAGARLHRIIESTTHAKAQLQGMTKAAILQYSALLTAPSMLQMIPGAAGRVRPTFNVVISNVPGPDRPLYFRGARLEAAYPMSVPVHGQALNITVNSYDGQMCFGFTGCRDTVPHLQRLAVFCGEALGELERAVR
jgi:diacylglycerol O-acyltransferase